MKATQIAEHLAIACIFNNYSLRLIKHTKVVCKIDTKLSAMAFAITHLIYIKK